MSSPERDPLGRAALVFLLAIILISCGSVPGTPTTPSKGIYGRVTYKGSPVQSLHVNLVFYNGSGYNITPTSTDRSGIYRFANVPSLQPGQSCFVQYLNGGSQEPGSANYVEGWTCPTMKAYTTGTDVSGGDFDIADVVLQSPADKTANAAFPTTFTWVSRPATPDDSYEFTIADLKDWDPFSLVPSLGHVNTYALDRLPKGFSTGSTYQWLIRIHAPDGGVGASLHKRDISFAQAD
jgi:hypothetical protein